jgi:hypothetical protein
VGCGEINRRGQLQNISSEVSTKLPSRTASILIRQGNMSGQQVMSAIICAHGSTVARQSRREHEGSSMHSMHSMHYALN